MCIVTTCNKYFVIYSECDPKARGSEQMCPYGFTWVEFRALVVRCLCEFGAVTTRVAPSRVETLREMAKSPKLKLVQKVRESGKIANSPKSRDRGSLQAAENLTAIFFQFTL